MTPRPFWHRRHGFHIRLENGFSRNNPKYCSVITELRDHTGTEPLKEIFFAKLLDICSDPDHKRFHQAWYEFDRRYRPVIFGRIRKYLLKFSKANHLEIVEDIASEVTYSLLKNEYRALKTFRGREQESKLIAFLNVICIKSSYGVMLRYLGVTESNLEDETRNIKNFIKLNRGSEEEVHDYFVNRLRLAQSDTQKSKFNKERDIVVYILRMIAGFKAKEVEQIVALNITAGNVDNVVSRLSNLLKESKD